MQTSGKNIPILPAKEFRKIADLNGFEAYTLEQILLSDERLKPKSFLRRIVVRALYALNRK